MNSNKVIGLIPYLLLFSFSLLALIYFFYVDQLGTSLALFSIGIAIFIYFIASSILADSRRILDTLESKKFSDKPRASSGNLEAEIYRHGMEMAIGDAQRKYLEEGYEVIRAEVGEPADFYVKKKRAKYPVLVKYYPERLTADRLIDLIRNDVMGAIALTKNNKGFLEIFTLDISDEAYKKLDAQYPNMEDVRLRYNPIFFEDLLNCLRIEYGGENNNGKKESNRGNDKKHEKQLKT